MRFRNGVAVVLLCSFQFHVSAHEAVKSVGPDESLKMLQEGNQRFSGSNVTSGKPVAERRAENAQSQHPFAIVVACADSRTAPEIVFDQTIGDLFVIRTAGNLVDEYALGSIEYGVEHLDVRLIVVLGHERCGAVTAALGSDTAPGHLNAIVRDIQPAIKAAAGMDGDALANSVLENARQMVAQIRTRAELGERASDVRILAGVYDLDTGIVAWFDDKD
jgi:carbonic anhydrase